MPGSPPRNSALADAMRKALGDRLPEQPDATSSVTLGPAWEGVMEEPLTGSAALEQMYQTLRDATRGARFSTGQITALAIVAGRFGMHARIKPDETHVIDSTIRSIGKALLASRSGETANEELLLALACLAYGPHAKQMVEDTLVRALVASEMDRGFLNAGWRDAKQRRLLENRLSIAEIRRRSYAELGEIKAQQDRVAETHATRLKLLDAARQATIQRLRKQLAAAVEHLLAIQALSSITPPIPGDSDLRLILLWGNSRMINSLPLTTSEVRRQLGNWEFTRLTSARSAEVVAQLYFRSLGSAVEDISVKQLEQSSAGWLTHDLLVDGAAVDVKNARQCASDPSRYSEYLVPQFKYDRRSQSDVSIAAVFSQYLTADQFEEGVQPQCTFLGLASQDDLTALAGWITRTFPDLMTVGHWDTARRLPGWCFEFSDRHLPERNEGLRAVAMLADEIVKEPAAAQSLEAPEMFAALAPDVATAEGLFHAAVPSHQWSVEHSRMWHHLSSLSASIGFSRRSLFAFVLSYTLAQSRRDSGTWTPQWLNRWLFLSTSGPNRRRPLGLDDPLGYVASIVDAMQSLWAQCRPDLQNFRLFRLASPWILVGVDHAGVETTIMAYCGGAFLKQDGSFLMKCGLSPLVLGQDQSCPACHRLICHECGYCSVNCEPKRRELRKATAA